MDPSWSLSVFEIVDGDRAAVFNQDPGHHRLLQDREVGVIPNRVEIRRSGVTTGTVADRRLHLSASELLGTIDVRIVWNARLLCRLEEDPAKRMRMRVLHDRKGAVGSMKRVIEFSVRFRADTIGKHIIIAPSGIPKLSPFILVAHISSHEDHTVEHARPAENAPARVVDDTVVEARLRHSTKAPVRFSVNLSGRRAGKAGEDRIGVSTSFDQCDGRIAAFA